MRAKLMQRSRSPAFLPDSLNLTCGPAESIAVEIDVSLSAMEGRMAIFAVQGL